MLFLVYVERRDSMWQRRQLQRSYSTDGEEIKYEYPKLAE
jgi:hypothetical protein